jgi:hypothetical protein
LACGWIGRQTGEDTLNAKIETSKGDKLNESRKAPGYHTGDEAPKPSERIHAP